MKHMTTSGIHSAPLNITKTMSLIVKKYLQYSESLLNVNWFLQATWNAGITKNMYVSEALERNRLKHVYKYIHTSISMQLDKQNIKEKCKKINKNNNLM